MSAYSYPAPQPAVPAAAAADPTAVVGRRIGAIVVDWLLFAVIMAFVGPTPLSPLAEYYEVPDGVDDVCETVRDAEDVSSCVEIGDRVYFTETGDAAIQIVVWFAFVGLYAALQGATGFTPGKAIFAIKVVDERGATPGFGRSLGRTALWVVDAAPWCLPLVGFVTGLTTKGHRRVGDMAVKTFVVRKAHTGPVVVPGMATSAPYGPSPGPGGWGSPGAPTGAGWGAPPAASGPPPGWGAPPTGGYPPAGSPGSPPGSGPWAPPGPGPSGSPTAAWPPDSRPAPPPGAAGASAPAPAAPPTPSGEGPAVGEPRASVGAPQDAPAGPGGAGERETYERAPEGGAGPGEDQGTRHGGPPGDDTAPGTTGAGGSGGTGSAGAGGADTGGSGAAATTGAAGGAATTGTTGGGGATGSTGYNPQWDAARGTYIVWEPQRGQWLGWDEASKQWRPL